MKIRKNFLSLFLLLTTLGCSAPAAMSGNGRASQLNAEKNAEGRAESSDSENKDDQGKDQDQDVESANAKDQSETVARPSKVTGSFLYCLDISAPGTELTASVGCSYLNSADGSKVSLTRYTWKALSAVEKEVEAIVTDLPATDLYQVRFDLKAKSHSALRSYQLNMNFSLELTHADGTVSQFLSNAPKAVIRWQKVDANLEKAPQNAPGVGVEPGKHLSKICRMNYSMPGETIKRVLPGKMLDALDNNAWCYYPSTDINNLGVKNEGIEVLVFDRGKIEQVLDWVTVTSNEIPVLGFSAGIDEKGNPIYVCRAINAVGPDGIVTKGSFPGGYHPARGTCEFEYYGWYQSRTFEVLTWKSQDIRDASLVLP